MTKTHHALGVGNTMFWVFRPKEEILNININSTTRFLATLEMTVLLSFR